MQYLSKKATDYLTKNYKLDSINIAKVRYSIEVILNEISKILLLLIVFTLINELKAFIYIIINLLLFKPLLGGLHFNGYIKCYLYTMFFFLGITFFSQNININIYILSCFFSFNLVTIIYCTRKVIRDEFKNFSLQIILQRYIPIVIFFHHFILYMFIRDSLYLKVFIWSITFQSLQLLLSRGGEYYKKQEKIQIKYE